MIGWIIGAAMLLLLLALMLINVGLLFQYGNGEVSLWLRVLFFRCRLLPAKEKGEKPSAKKEKAKAGPLPDREKKGESAPGNSDGTKKEPLPQKEPAKIEIGQQPADEESRSLKEMFGLVQDLLYSANGPVGTILRHLVVRKLTVTLVVAREDAAETAIAYGQMNGWLHGAMAALSHLICLKKPQVQVLADYLSQKDRLSVSFLLTERIFFLLGAAIRFGWRFLTRQIKSKP